ncbi:helix-turn-helix transcriptional regulator [Neorhizobium lilium]|nr:LuxR family transcriptional regulator [Neorhizobium lilium]
MLERQSILSSEISAAESRLEITQALARITHEFGFRHFMLVAVPQIEEVLLERVLLESNLPKDYIREYDRQRLLRKCPVDSTLAHIAPPLCWTLDDSIQPHDMTFTPELVNLQRKYEMITSVAMALHSVDGSGFRLHLDGSRPRLTQVELNEIGMILLHVFGVFDRIRRAESRAASLLTLRELEVLRWTSQGKTSVEIGKILSLSDHTINAYMNNAIKKLDCANRTQLVAKALRLKLIA